MTLVLVFVIFKIKIKFFLLRATIFSYWKIRGHNTYLFLFSNFLPRFFGESMRESNEVRFTIIEPLTHRARTQKKGFMIL